MFMWDELTPTTLSASSTNQLKVSLGVRATVMDMVIFRTIFFKLLVFFTFMLLTLHFAY